MTEKYVFIIDTDQHAGNFEREMCACCTGQTGECGVGDKEKKKFIDEVGEDKWEDMMELVEQRPDDHGCHRPTSIWPTARYLKPKKHYQSVAIFFNKRPAPDIITMMKDRAELFIKGNERIFNKPRTMKILGFRLLKETTTIEEIVMADNNCAECGCFDVSRLQKDYTFPYGRSGPEQVELTVEVPVYKCNNDKCDFQWMNWEAEQIIDAYVEQWKNEQNKDKTET